MTEEGMVCDVGKWYLVCPGCKHTRDRGHTVVGGAKRDDRHGMFCNGASLRWRALMTVTPRAHATGIDGGRPGHGRCPSSGLVSMQFDV